MGYTVLYIAFGIVALWLLGEVLLQYKAQLHWRILAFGGFVGVVVGVATRDIMVIALGTVTFALGQTFVTLAYRSGYSEGWALGGGPGGGSARRRETGGEDGPRSEPTLQVTEIEPVPGRAAEATGYAEAPVPVYQPQAMGDDTGEYAAYGRQQQPQPSAYGADPYADPYAGQDPLGGGYGTGYDGAYEGAYGGAGYDGAGYDGYGGGYAGAAAPGAGDQTTAMPAYQDSGYGNQGYGNEGYGNQGYGEQGWQEPAAYQDQGYQEPAYQNEGAAPLFRDEAYQDQTAAMPAYQDNGYDGGYQPDPGGSLGRGAYLPPEAAQYQQPQAAYLDPGQYQQQPPPEPQQPQQQPQQQGQQPYPDVYGDPYGTPPGGVWVPQQQTGEQQYYPPPPAADPSGYDPYRY